MRSETLQAFVYNCPHLKDVGLSSISCITGELMESLASRLKRLQRLDVSWNFDLTNQAVSAILSSCPVLEELLLCGVRQITEKPFLSIIASKLLHQYSLFV
nr:F-box/LRR-repeat protein 16-like [Lytechinus pictus]